eukprot:gnl/TRDRNA2_/TRDRNA2_71348_c0_seq1.p1 gnl/TRDRNA2_/TRDRNA2_71348_c0~~gnl/TRDRNA2_/TRDRNA2_71348_c0_seq1.p1  ORF type:complete len:404 (-),score=54.45 gnl/TRDRNA2_/TRDRNA2_71348_c0_seq1:34-1245(-)
MGAESTKCTTWCRQDTEIIAPHARRTGSRHEVSFAAERPYSTTDETMERQPAMVTSLPHSFSDVASKEHEAAEFMQPQSPRCVSNGFSRMRRMKAHKNDPIYYSFSVSQIVNHKIEHHIAEVSRLVRSNEYTYAELRGHICRIAALAWHDRDGEVYHLRQQCRETCQELVRAHRHEDVDVQQEASRLLLVSSAIPERELLCKAVRKPEWILKYDCEMDSFDDLKAAIEAKSRELQPKTVALLTPGIDEHGHCKIANGCSLHVGEDDKSYLSPEATALFRALGTAAQCRVDLLACDLAGEPGGLPLIQELEGITGKSVAVSTHHTSNLKHGGDWISKTKHVSAPSIYFHSERLQKWNGILQSHYTAELRDRHEAIDGGWRKPIHYSDSEFEAKEMLRAKRYMRR